MTSFSSVILTATTWPVVALLLKVTLVLALGLAAARFAKRAATSHLILTMALAAAVLMPIVETAAPPRLIEIGVVATDSEVRAATTAMVAARPGHAPFAAHEASSGDVSAAPLASVRDASQWASLGALLLVVWLAGAFVMMATLVIDLRHVHAVRREGLPDAALAGRLRLLARRAGLRANVEILVTAQVSGPLVTGLAPPAILLPADALTWPDDALLRAVAHEMEHVRRGDWPLQVFARTICAVYWFHPFAWMTWRRLCLAAERACDDAVMRVTDPASYAEQLVMLARRRQLTRAGATLGMAERSHLSARVRALLDPHVRRGPSGWPATVATAMVFVAVVAVVAPLRAERTTPASSESADAEPIASLDRELYEAAARGQVDAVNDLISRGGRVNAVIPGDGSPLIGGVRSGRIEVVRLLLDLGAEPAMPVQLDGSPLIVAARGGNLAIVRILLDAGAPVDDIVPGDETALIGASHQGYLDVVRYLVMRGADVNLRAWSGPGPGRSDGEWRTPLVMAVRGGHQQVAAYLRSAGARE